MRSDSGLYHATLRRQLRRLGLASGCPPDASQWEKLLQRVSDSYAEADDGRYTLERSIEVSSAEMRALHEVLSSQAYQDALTGLPNRAALTEMLTTTLSRRRAGAQSAAVLFIDLDGFKRVNDSLGHAAGDELLMRSAERIRLAVRDGDVVGRLGGDEFVVLCPYVADVDVAIGVARRIAAQLETSYHINNQDASISASIGIAIAVPGESSAEDMLRRADIAMYEAKTDGRSPFAVFDEEMRMRIDERLSVETALRRAIANEEFVLHYQPVVRLSDSKVMGMEALLRWQRPGYGLVLPGSFIDVAEQTRLITQIDAWVVREACLAAVAWPDPDATVAVNLTGRDLEDDNLLNAISQALLRSGLAPRRLIVELTETMLMSDNVAIAANLARIQALGVKVAIDDFGTGYSSLSYLRQLPADTLKIDRSFVESIDDDAGAAIVGAVVTMAHALGLAVVAEGVERPHQVARLRLLGCDAAQGYCFARPQPVENLMRFFAPERHDELGDLRRDELNG